MLRLLSACLVVSSLSGCATKLPDARAYSSNPDYVVDTLFTHEDCTVYRFRDVLMYHYYVRCDGASVAPDAAVFTDGKRAEAIQTLPSLR
jgi:hypothetical protein